MVQLLLLNLKICVLDPPLPTCVCVFDYLMKTPEANGRKHKAALPFNNIILLCRHTFLFVLFLKKNLLTSGCTLHITAALHSKELQKYIVSFAPTKNVVQSVKILRGFSIIYQIAAQLQLSGLKSCL